MGANSDEQLTGKQARKLRGKKIPSEPQPKVDAQPFDNLTKALFGLDGAKIIPELLTGAEVMDARNIEIDRSKLKADLVFKILYKGLVAILNLELQSGADSNIGARLFQYLAGLHEFYKELPILCVVIYLFRCQVEMPPYIIECADKRSIVFNYDVIRLWEVESEWILKRRIIPLYILLPGTKSPKVDLLKQALHEMAQVYDRPQLAYRFVWFYQILRRTDTMSEEDKQVIEKELRMQFNYRELVKDDPIIQELFAKHKAEGRVEGRAEGEARGEARGIRKSILSILNARFPALAVTPQAQQAVASIEDPEKLDQVLQALVVASDEQTVRRVLKLPVQGDLL